MTQTLLTTPGRQIETKSGVTYTADARGNIVIQDGDLTDILHAGCKFPFANKPQIVANRCVIGNSVVAGNGNYSRIEARYQHLIGPQAVGQIRLGVPSFMINPSGEALLGNGFSWQAALEITSPACYQKAFTLGTDTPAVQDGMPFLISEPLSFDLPAGAQFFTRQGFITASTAANLPGATAGLANGDAAFISAAATSQVFGTGVLTQPAGGVAYSEGVCGLILGIPAYPMPAVAYLGDSIADIVGETSYGDAYGNLGFIGRGLAMVNGFAMPYVKQTVGSQTFQKNTIDLSPRTRGAWPYVTHLLCELGTNDTSNNATFPQMQTYASNVWQAAKRTIGPYGKPLQVAQSLIMPRFITGSSPDNWATPGGMTGFAPGFAPGGVRDQFNAWCKSQVGGGLLDAVIDVNKYVEDQNNPGKWITNGVAGYPTIDGIHPTTALHILASQAVNAWASTIVP